MKLLATAASVGLLFALTGCPGKGKKESINKANEGAKAVGQKQWETAIEHYTKATELWSDNHSAWWGLYAAWAGKQDWGKASEAVQRAVQIADDQPMYHMHLGIALYNKAIDQAKEDTARRENKKKEEVEPDLTTVNFEKSKQHLEKAIKLNPEMWRAHYYLGRINRDTDKPKEAADALTKALSFAPVDPSPWVALAELYRKWDYTDQAQAVASQGTTVVPGANEVSDLWYVVGMTYDDKGQYDKAIEAFDKALESRRDNHAAKFQRGQAYFRKNDFPKAKKDFEEFAKGGGSKLEFAKQQAQKMLLDIAAKQAMQGGDGGAGGGAGPKPSPEDLVKGGKKG